MHCQYCHKRVSVFKLLSGQPFCSKEHRELYLNTQSKDAIKRLLSSFSEEGEGKETAEPASPAPAEPRDLAPLEPSTNAVVLAKPAAPADLSLTGPSTDQDLPEAPFVRQSLADPRNRPVALISRTIAEPFSGQVELPASPVPEPLAVEPATKGEPVEAEPEPPAASLAPLELDVAPIGVPEPGPQLSAATEPRPEEPSIVPAPVTQIVVLRESGLLSLPMLEGQAPEGSVSTREPQDVTATPGPPALVSLGAKPAPETLADGLTPPPPAPERAIWPKQKEAGSVPPPVVPVGALRPRSSGPRAPGPFGQPCWGSGFARTSGHHSRTTADRLKIRIPERRSCRATSARVGGALCAQPARS